MLSVYPLHDLSSSPEKPGMPEMPCDDGWFDTYGYILLVGIANEEAAAAAAAAAATVLAAAADATATADAAVGEWSLILRCSEDDVAEGEGEQLLSPVWELVADGGVSNSCWWDNCCCCWTLCVWPRPLPLWELTAAAAAANLFICNCCCCCCKCKAADKEYWLWCCCWWCWWFCCSCCCWVESVPKVVDDGEDEDTGELDDWFKWLLPMLTLDVEGDKDDEWTATEDMWLPLLWLLVLMLLLLLKLLASELTDAVEEAAAAARAAATAADDEFCEVEVKCELINGWNCGYFGSILSKTNFDIAHYFVASSLRSLNLLIFADRLS